MKKSYLVASLVMVALLMSYVAWGADLLGNWSGGEKKTGSATARVNFYGYRPIVGSVFGSKEATMAAIQVWDSAALWTSDSLANDSSGSLDLTEWMGGKGAVLWQVVDTGSTYPRVFVRYQVQYVEGEQWHTAYTIGDTSSVETYQIDTLDFSDPKMQAPRSRFYVDGITSNPAQKKVMLSLSAYFIRKASL